MPDPIRDEVAFPYSVSRTWKDNIPSIISAAIVIVAGSALGLPSRRWPDGVSGGLKAALLLVLFAAVWMIVVRWRRRGDPQAIEVRLGEVLLPRRGFRTGFVAVRFEDIRDIIVSQKGEMAAAVEEITVDSTHGKLRVLSTGFDEPRDFADFTGAILTRWKAAKPIRNPRASRPHAPPPMTAATAPASPVPSLVKAITEQRKTDPLVGAKVAGKEIVERLTHAMRNERGVHAESLLCALGALAGYSCQASLRAQSLLRGLPGDVAFTIIETKDGGVFFSGDALNAKLAESQHSVWSLAAAAAQQAGATELPDIGEIFRRCAMLIGTDRFGVPPPIDGHPAGDLPINYLRKLWQPLLPTVRDLTADPNLWPIAYGVAIQETLARTKEVLAPGICLRIVMEAAIPMSKVKL